MPGLTIPVNVLDVIIFCMSKLIAAFQTAPLQYVLSAFALHTCSEPVNTGPAPDFRLIGPFWHLLVTPSKFILQLPTKHYTVRGYFGQTPLSNLMDLIYPFPGGRIYIIYLYGTPRIWFQNDYNRFSQIKGNIRR